MLLVGLVLWYIEVKVLRHEESNSEKYKRFRRVEVVFILVLSVLPIPIFILGEIEAGRIAKQIDDEQQERKELTRAVSPRLLEIKTDEAKAKLGPFKDKGINVVIVAVDEPEAVSTAFGIRDLFREGGLNVPDPVQPQPNEKIKSGIKIETRDASYPDMPVLDAANALIALLWEEDTDAELWPPNWRLPPLTMRIVVGSAPTEYFEEQKAGMPAISFKNFREQFHNNLNKYDQERIREEMAQEWAREHPDPALFNEKK